MSTLAGWAIPIALWIAVTLGARGWMAAAGLIRCRAGDWGTAFLLGFTGFTVLAYAGAAAGIPVGRGLLLGSALVILATGLAAARRAPRRAAPVEEPWSPLEMGLGLLLAAVLASSILNAVYFPIDAMDAHSYDGRARFMVHDGTLDIALYHWPGERITGRTNITYPPLYSLGLAVTHAFGGWQSKILSGLMSVAWPVMLYGALRQHLPRHASLLWVLLLALTPEVYSHASFGLLNVPAMALVLGEAILLARFVSDRDRRSLIAAGILAAGAAGVRPDALAPHAALMISTVLVSLGNPGARRGWKQWLPAMILAGAAPLLTWGTWTLYLKFVVGAGTLAPMTSEGNLGPGLLFRVLPRLLFSFTTYGPVFVLWGISLLLLWWRRGRIGPALFAQLGALLTLGLLVGIFASLDLGYGGGARDVIDSSLKRSLFYVVPLAGFAAALTAPWSLLADAGRGLLHARPPRTPDDPATRGERS